MTVGELTLFIGLLLNAATTILAACLAWNAGARAAVAVEKIEEVRHETNSMRTVIEVAKKAEGKLEEQQESALRAAVNK